MLDGEMPTQDNANDKLTDYERTLGFLNSVLEVDYKNVHMKPNHRMIKCEEIGFTAIFNYDDEMIGYLFDKNSII
jgi:hypothetical protein